MLKLPSSDTFTSTPHALFIASFALCVWTASTVASRTNCASSYRNVDSIVVVPSSFVVDVCETNFAKSLFIEIESTNNGK